MTQSEIIPGLKVKVQLVAQNIVGQENKIIVRTIETVNDDRVTFKGSNARYYLRSSWMQPLVNGVEFFSGKLTYKIIY